MEFKPLENEIWIDAKSFKEDYSGLYIVSNLGRCWSIRNKKFVGHWKDGYWMVGLYKNGKVELIMIGRLMLISFGIPIPKYIQGLPTNKLQAMHLDGDSHNNHLGNFQWGDAKENQNEINARIRQSEAHKGKKNHNYGKYGKDCPNSKPILQYSKDGKFIREWDCARDAQRKLGINNQSISSCAKGKRLSAGGYRWKYAA